MHIATVSVDKLYSQIQISLGSNCLDLLLGFETKCNLKGVSF